MATIVTVIGGSPTIVRAYEKGFRTEFDETSFIDDAAGAYVRRWLGNGEAAQSFGHWTGTRGGALAWAHAAHTPEAKARQISRDIGARFLDESAYAAWRAEMESVVYAGELLVHDQVEDELVWCSPDHMVPWSLDRLCYHDASGQYDVKPGVAPYRPGRHSDTAYDIVRDGKVVATIVRPVHRDMDNCQGLALAIHAALKV